MSHLPHTPGEASKYRHCRSQASPRLQPTDVKLAGGCGDLSTETRHPRVCMSREQLLNPPHPELGEAKPGCRTASLQRSPQSAEDPCLLHIFLSLWHSGAFAPWSPHAPSSLLSWLVTNSAFSSTFKRLLRPLGCCPRVANSSESLIYF